MRIVFFGSPNAALPALEALLQAGHRVELVVTQPDRPSGRGRRLSPCPVKVFAMEKGIPTYNPERIRKAPEALDILKRTGADIHVIVAYGQIMPGPVIDLPPRRSLNVHFSLLPLYRGASPVAWAIRNGETKTGVTIFRLNEKMDEGDILASANAEILPGDTAGSLETRLARLGADLLLETLEGIDARPLRPQDHAAATYAPKLRKEDGLIDWRAGAGVIDRHIRAMTPWPSAYTFLKGERLIVLKGRPAPIRPEPAESAPASAPGIISLAGRAGLRVFCGGGTEYEIERLQLEGRKPLEAAVFVQGGRIKPGDAFSSGLASPERGL